MWYSSSMGTKRTIRWRLAKAGLTHDKTAKRLRVSRPTVTRWVVGTRTPGLGHARKLARLLKCRVDDLKPDA